MKSRVDRAFRPVSPPANEVAVLARSSPKKIPGQERGSRHTFLRYSCGLVAVGAIVACAAPVDLSAVQKYASTTAAAGTSFSALAADFTASCLRGNAALDGLVYATNSRSVPTIVGILSTAQLTDAATIVPTLDPGYTYVAPSPGPTTPPLSAPAILPRQATCDDAADVSKSWDKANATVLAYVQSLGNLADVDAIPTPNPAPLASPLEEVGVSSAAVQAGSNLLTEIASFYYRNKSDRYIREFLAQVNPSMPGAMETLEVVNAAYSLELASEFTFIAARYPGFARDQLKKYAAATSSIAAIDAEVAQNPHRRKALESNRAALEGQQISIARGLLRKRAAVVSALDLINRQRKASASYGAAIEQILKTHEQLYAASQGSATLKDYLTIIQTTGAPVLTNLVNLAQAIK